MIKIKTEIGLAAILVITLVIAILLVIGFDKTAEDLDRIQKAVDENQAMLEGTIKANLKK